MKVGWYAYFLKILNRLGEMHIGGCGKGTVNSRDTGFHSGREHVSPSEDRRNAAASWPVAEHSAQSLA